MKKSILLAFAVLLSAISHSNEAAEPQSFDDIVFLDIINQEAELGFGGYKLIHAMVAHEKEIRELYKHGDPRIYVEVFPAANQDVSAKTRFTFKVFQKIADGMFFKQGPLQAFLMIDVHTDYRLHGASRKIYETDGVKVVRAEL